MSDKVSNEILHFLSGENFFPDDNSTIKKQISAAAMELLERRKSDPYLEHHRRFFGPWADLICSEGGGDEIKKENIAKLPTPMTDAVDTSTKFSGDPGKVITALLDNYRRLERECAAMRDALESAIQEVVFEGVRYFLLGIEEKEETLAAIREYEAQP